MNRITRTALVVALGLASSAAMAGEIEHSTVYGENTENMAAGDNAHALQRIGVSAGAGSKIKDTDISGKYAANAAYGAQARARQDIGVAQDGGRLTNATIDGHLAFNRADGDGSTAVQEIGKANGHMSVLANSTIIGVSAFNNALARAKAEQKIGVAE